jgi:hypothetical protein
LARPNAKRITVLSDFKSSGRKIPAGLSFPVVVSDTGIRSGGQACATIDRAVMRRLRSNAIVEGTERSALKRQVERPLDRTCANLFRYCHR